MHHYRLYCLDPQMHILERREFDAEDDEAAVALVARAEADVDTEIWEDHRKVAVVRARAR